jgi:hypothetical protein
VKLTKEELKSRLKVANDLLKAYHDQSDEAVIGEILKVATPDFDSSKLGHIVSLAFNMLEHEARYGYEGSF